jgi:hypothetical protein
MPAGHMAACINFQAKMLVGSKPELGSPFATWSSCSFERRAHGIVQPTAAPAIAPRRTTRRPVPFGVRARQIGQTTGAPDIERHETVLQPESPGVYALQTARVPDASGFHLVSNRRTPGRSAPGGSSRTQTPRRSGPMLVWSRRRSGAPVPPTLAQALATTLRGPRRRKSLAPNESPQLRSLRTDRAQTQCPTRGQRARCSLIDRGTQPRQDHGFEESNTARDG